jgi:hypothetical protein
MLPSIKEGKYVEDIVIISNVVHAGSGIILLSGIIADSVATSEYVFSSVHQHQIQW